MSLGYCVIGAEDQVKHTVSNFNDIGPEFNIMLTVSPKKKTNNNNILVSH